MTTVREKAGAGRLGAFMLAICIPLLLVGCWPKDDIHNLDDRIRLMECRWFNATTRYAHGEEVFGQQALEDALEYDEETIEHDEELIEHDEELIEHDEELIEHDEELIEHDEVFVKLVACRRDTLELQKKYLACAPAIRECHAKGKPVASCVQLADRCRAGLRLPE